MEKTKLLKEINKLLKALRNAVPYKKYGVSENEYKILAALENLGEINSFAALKEKVKLHDSQISVLLASLANKGLIERKKNSQDRRSVDMKITQSGCEVAASVRNEITALEEYLKNALSDEKTEEYISLTSDIIKLMKDYK